MDDYRAAVPRFPALRAFATLRLRVKFHMRAAFDGLSPRKAGWYPIAALALLAVAAALRFYGLTDDGLRYDEAVAALNSRVDISELRHKTVINNSSPMLYPLVSWAIQRVDSSVFSVRAPLAAASVGTVAVLLFALPRAGVGRNAAFFAALAATLSPVAIEHAQDAREYSADALAAALLITGALRYSRHGKRDLLCGALLAAPMIQYGLALFGTAILAAAALFPPQRPKRFKRHSRADARHPHPSPLPSRERGSDGCDSHPASVERPLAPPTRERIAQLRSWARARAGLWLPAAFFAAGCAFVYWTTLPRHLTKGHLRTGYANHLYAGDYGDPLSVLGFAASKIWETLGYHLPDGTAAFGAAAFAGALAVSAWKRKPDIAAIVCAFALGAAVLASVGGVYPLGEIRATVYLSPALFVGLGIGAARIADSVGAVVRRRRAAVAAAVVIAVAIALAVADDLRRRNPYLALNNWADVMSIIERDSRRGDLVYASGDVRAVAEFHRTRTRVPAFAAGASCAEPLNEGCVPTIAAAAKDMGGAERIWILHYQERPLHKDLRNALANPKRLQPEKPIRLLLIDDESDIATLTGEGDAAARVGKALSDRFAELANLEPIVEAGFSVYAKGGSVIFAKSPCSVDDTLGRFALSAAPVNEDDLPERWRESGHASLNFDFAREGSIFGGKCLASVPLPGYPIGAVSAGQWGADDGGGSSWSGAARFAAGIAPYRAAYERVKAKTPAASARFDVYIEGDSLIYVREPCSENDARGRFSLSTFPANPRDLSDEARANGQAHESLNFDFAMRGAVFDGRCVARVNLPGYPLALVETGQWLPESGGVWSAKIPFDAYYDRFRAAAEKARREQPALDSVFDVYWDGGDGVVYIKDPCAPNDTAGRFLLSVFPSDMANVPPEMRERGLEHESLNFDFERWGASFDGLCAIIAPLPEYPIREIETGQWLPGEAMIWKGRLRAR